MVQSIQVREPVKTSWSSKVAYAGVNVEIDMKLLNLLRILEVSRTLNYFNIKRWLMNLVWRSMWLDSNQSNESKTLSASEHGLQECD